MRFTQLRSFHAVATAGGFNAAAYAVHITQPTLTARVGALEDVRKRETSRIIRAFLEVVRKTKASNTK